MIAGVDGAVITVVAIDVCVATIGVGLEETRPRADVASFLRTRIAIHTIRVAAAAIRQ